MQMKINCVLCVTVPNFESGELPSPKEVSEGIKKLLNDKVFPEVKDVDLKIRMNMDNIRSAP